MKTQFKVGNTVRVYGNTQTGAWDGMNLAPSRLATVVTVFDRDWLNVSCDEHKTVTVHAKQCRRIKTRRRVWACVKKGADIASIPCSGPLHTTRKMAEERLSDGYEVVEFLEVRP